MNHRELILQSLAHKSTPRAAVDFGGTICSGIHVSCVEGLRRHFGLKAGPVKVHEPYQMLGFIDEDLGEALGSDVACARPASGFFGFAPENWKEWRTPWNQTVLVPGAFNVSKADNGDVLIYPEGDTSAPPSARMPSTSFFFDSIIRQPDFEEDDLKVEDNTEEFKPLSDAMVAKIAENARLARATGKAVVGQVPGTSLGDIAAVPAPFMKHPKGIRDVAEWYMSLVARTDFVHAVFERQTSVALENLAKVHAAVGDDFDVVFVCGTDLGTQNSTLCSMETLTELFVPYYKRMNGWVHANTNWKVLKHCCGAIESFIDTFADAGFDILNPVQCSAKGMDAANLKRLHGDRIVFWGGGVDTQKILPFGTPQQVYDQVVERCRIFSPGGGFVFNSIHNIQALTPIENIASMIKALADYNKKGV